MPTFTRKEPRIPPLDLLRCTGVGVATVELVYLVCWISLALSLIGGPGLQVRGLTTPLNSLTFLGQGMVGAAVFGGIAGLVTALGLNLVGGLIALRTVDRADQALARSLWVRNQTR